MTSPRPESPRPEPQPRSMSALARVEIHQVVAMAVADAVEPLLNEIKTLRREVAQAQEPRKVRTVSDIMAEFQYTRATIRKNPWMMPNWGRSDFPGKIQKWKPETYAAWFAVSLDQRRREWDKKPLREKEAILRGAK